jgi:hypothetical protein
LTSSSAISSSLVAVLAGFFFSDFGFEAFAVSFFSVVPGAFGVVNFSFCAVFGVFAGFGEQASLATVNR